MVGDDRHPIGQQRIEHQREHQPAPASGLVLDDHQSHEARGIEENKEHQGKRIGARPVRLGGKGFSQGTGVFGIHFTQGIRGAESGYQGFLGGDAAYQSDIGGAS